jgi:hypothetical protein
MGVILGLDPGQRRDPAGLAVVEGFDVLHLERHLGLPYPELAERVAVLLAQLPPASLVAGGQPRCTVGGYADCMRAEAAAVRATPVVVDATGVGRAVVDLLEALHLTPIAVTLTGGGKVRVSGRELSLPRRVLFLPLQAAMEAGRLRVAEGCPYRAELAAELLAARGGASGAESRGKGHHGALMTAVALAVWWRGLALR